MSGNNDKNREAFSYALRGAELDGNLEIISHVESLLYSIDKLECLGVKVTLSKVSVTFIEGSIQKRKS